MIKSLKKLMGKNEKNEEMNVDYTDKTLFKTVFDEWVEKKKPEHKTHSLTISLEEISEVYGTLNTVSRITKSMKERGKVDVSELEFGCKSIIVKETDQMTVIKKDLFRFEFLNKSNKYSSYLIFLEHEGKELKIAQGELSFTKEEIIEKAYGKCMFNLNSRNRHSNNKDWGMVKKAIEEVLGMRMSLKEERNVVFVDEIAWISPDKEPWMELLKETLEKLKEEAQSLSTKISEKQDEERKNLLNERANKEKQFEENKEYFRTLTSL